MLRRIARPLLAAIHVYGGLNALRNVGYHAQQAEPVVSRIADVLPERMPRDVATLVRVDASIKIGAGILLGLGRSPRLAATVLAASTVPSTIAAHPFWQEDDKAAKANQKVHFVKNLSILGGLLIAAGDTAGRPSLRWRARRVAGNATHRVHDAAGSVRDALP